MPKGVYQHKRIPLSERFEKWVYRCPMSGCWLWTGTVDNHGYGMLQRFSDELGWRQERASRIAWRLYRGEIPEGVGVLHRCDVPCCVNPAHLFLGSQRENARDMVNKGRSSFGAKNGHAKLTDEKVLEIRALCKSLSAGAVARLFGVSRSAILNVKNRKLWRHV